MSEKASNVFRKLQKLRIPFFVCVGPFGPLSWRPNESLGF